MRRHPASGRIGTVAKWALLDRLRRARLVTERVRETKKARTTIDGNCLYGDFSVKLN